MYSFLVHEGYLDKSPTMWPSRPVMGPHIKTHPRWILRFLAELGVTLLGLEGHGAMHARGTQHTPTLGVEIFTPPACNFKIVHIPSSVYIHLGRAPQNPNLGGLPIPRSCELRNMGGQTGGEGVPWGVLAGGFLGQGAWNASGDEQGPCEGGRSLEGRHRQGYP